MPPAVMVAPYTVIVMSFRFKTPVKVTVLPLTEAVVSALFTVMVAAVIFRWLESVAVTVARGAPET